jgi:hypothetical protein
MGGFIMKTVMMFGPHSEERALDYALKQPNQWPAKYWPKRETPLVVLRAPDRRFAVCKASTALKLEQQGFKRLG